MTDNKLSAEAATRALRAVALPDILKVEDLAQHLGISHEAVRRALREGKLPGRRVGRRWLLSRSALLEWLNAFREDAPARPKGSLHSLPASVRLLRGEKAKR